jgi:hypothetical protein
MILWQNLRLICASFSLVLRLIIPSWQSRLRFICDSVINDLRFICAPFSNRLRLTTANCIVHLRSIFHGFALDPAVGLSELRPILARFRCS